MHSCRSIRYRHVHLRTDRRILPDLGAQVLPADREMVGEREYEKALRVLMSKYKRSQDKQKLLAALFRRGYQSSAVYRAVNEFLADASDE